MSSPQVTFLELLQTWKVLADKSHVDCMKVDMKNFFLQCKDDALLPITEVARRKTQILQLWVDTDWNMAKKNNPHWTKKEYWEKRFHVIDNAFGPILKEAYGMGVTKETAKTPKVEAKPAPQEVAPVPARRNPYNPPKLRVVSSFNFDMDDNENENTFWSGAESEAHTREYLKKLKEQAQ